jgi:hypothetical protein
MEIILLLNIDVQIKRQLRSVKNAFLLIRIFWGNVEKMLINIFLILEPYLYLDTRCTMKKGTVQYKHDRQIKKILLYSVFDRNRNNKTLIEIIHFFLLRNEQL